MFNYLYLNQIREYTGGRADAQQILHVAANGGIDLYAHTPELSELASRISPVKPEDCAIVEREYNASTTHEDGNFSDCAFALAGGISSAMCEGSEPFTYVLDMWRGHLGAPRLQWEDVDKDGISHRVLFMVYGADFIVFKDDIDELLSDVEEARRLNAEPAKVDMDPRERASFLRLIRFMCELTDIDISQHYKAYEILETMAAQKGLELPGSKNAIASKLKAAKEID